MAEKFDLPPEIVELNKRLADWYGIDSTTGRPMWRIVFADNEYEHRFANWVDFTREGLFLREVEEIRYVPKYSHDPDYAGKYILENLVLVPDVNARDLPTQIQSYEPLWTYENVLDKPLPPTTAGTRLIIDTVLAARGKKSMRKYVEPTAEESLEIKRQRVDKVQEELFGDSSDLADALHLHSAIVVPGENK